MKTYTQHSEQNSYMPETALVAAKAGKLTERLQALADIQSHRTTLENDIRLLQEEIDHSIQTVNDIARMVIAQMQGTQALKDCISRGVRVYVDCNPKVLTLEQTHINNGVLVKLLDSPVYLLDLEESKKDENTLTSVKVA